MQEHTPREKPQLSAPVDHTAPLETPSLEARTAAASKIQSAFRNARELQRQKSLLMGPVEEVRKYGSGKQDVLGASDAVPGVFEPYGRITKMKDSLAIQNNFYDRDGLLHYQVDFATHGPMPSGHWHELSTKGDAGSGHSATGGNAAHYPPSTAPAHFHQTVGDAPLAQQVANMSKDLPSKPAQRQAMVEQTIGKLAASRGVEPAVVKKGQAQDTSRGQTVRQAYLDALSPKK